MIGREASEIIVSPGQNFLNPPPVPETPTEMLTLGCTAVNSSATAWVIGKTVDEPSIKISPDSGFPVTTCQYSNCLAAASGNIGM